MSIVLIMLTIDSLAAISAGGSHVGPYTAINQHIDYKFDSNRGFELPVIGATERGSFVSIKMNAVFDIDIGFSSVKDRVSRNTSEHICSSPREKAKQRAGP
jgi:hypothetical protein